MASRQTEREAVETLERIERELFRVGSQLRADTGAIQLRTRLDVAREIVAGVAESVQDRVED